MARKYKMGDKHPTDKTLLFHSYNKNRKGGITWVTQETMDRYKGHDNHWSVYYLPKENYYGCTKMLKKRIYDHKHNGKNTTGYKVIKTFSNKDEAESYETKMQLKHNANGFKYTEERNNRISAKLKERWSNGNLHHTNHKKVICLNTGIVYESIKACEKELGMSPGNLGTHLRSPKRHVHGLQFRYFTTNLLKEKL